VVVFSIKEDDADLNYLGHAACVTACHAGRSCTTVRDVLRMAVPVRGFPLKNMRLKDRNKASFPKGLRGGNGPSPQLRDPQGKGRAMTDQPIELPSSPEVAKAQAKRLKTALAPNYQIPHGQALELIARVHGEQSWGRLNSLISQEASARNTPKATAPIDEDDRHSHPVDQSFLKAFWRGLQATTDVKVSSKSRDFAQRLLEQDILLKVSLEEWLDTLDLSMGQMIFDIGADNILKAANIEAVDRYDRPKARDTIMTSFGGLRPAAFARALIWLERLGFDTHPEVFCKPLKKELMKRSHLDSYEMDCFWHDKGKRRPFPTREFFFDPSVKDSGMERETFTGRKKLTIEIEKSPNSDGPIRSIHIYR
jgi:hypothetical protein